MRSYFGTDGIRDVANQGHLTPDMILRIGHAIGKVMHESRSGGGRPRIILVRDTRVSGPMISGILTGALLAHGIDVDDAGVLPTPACALLVRELSYDLGIVVSASHNPMPDNGIKLFGHTGRKLQDKTQAAIEEWIDQAAPEVDATGADIGRRTDFSRGADVYLESMVQGLFPRLDLSGMRIVLDAANGAGSTVGPRILAALGADVETVACEPDGLNINDGSGRFFTDRAIARVRETGADIGIVLDGDGDRVILVDETAEIRDGDHILGILARETATDTEDSARIVATVMSNMGLDLLARAAGVELLRTPVGDRYVAEKMEESGALFGGEQSGHIIFNTEDGWFGDGMYTALRILEIMRRDDRPLSSLADGLERFPQVLVNVVVREKPPLSEMAGVQEAFNRRQMELGDEGRILLRYSGTEMLARVMVEGRDADQIQTIADELAGILRSEIGA